MRGIGYNLQALVDNDKGSSFEAKCHKEAILNGIHEPIFALDTRRSPSPTTSTISSSFGGGGGNGSSCGGGGGGGHNNSANLVLISEDTMNHKWQVSVPQNEQVSGGRKDEWAAELQPISGAASPQRFGLGNGLEDWESLFSDSASHDQLRWISGDVDDTPVSLKQLLQGGNNNEIEDISGTEPWGNAATNFNSNLGVSSSGFTSALAPNSRVLNYNPNPLKPNSPLPVNHQFINQNMNNLDMSSVLLLANSNNSQKDQHQFEPQPKRHNLGIPNCNAGVAKTPFVDGFLPSIKQPQMGFTHQSNLLPPRQLLQKPFITPKQELTGGNREQISAASHLHQQQQQVIYDQLYKATELILSGNFSHAQAILARLNHQLSLNIKPFQRAAFYFKEALQTSLLEISDTVSPISSRVPTPVDGMFKIGAYKVLSEVSPLIQFVNFTSNQALLEALGDADSIHIIDFDIGFGAQWSSFLQELPRMDRSPPSLKITAFASPTTHHPIELGLMHENLTQFATKIGVSFELEVVNLDSFDPNSYSMSLENEAVAVNFPLWSASNHLPALPSLLSFIKRLSPKIMVSMDRGCERIDLPYPQHLLHTLQYYEILFNSLDAANVTSDTVSKIERFLFQPKIRSMVSGRLHFPQQMLPWKSVFASMGFSPVLFSNFAEAQAECLVKRTQVRGFHVEKHQASLVLCWQNRELMSVSAWRC